MWETCCIRLNRRLQVYFCAVASGKMILYIGLLDDAHGCSGRRVLAWRTLVWSKAGDAEGEKRKLRFFQAYAKRSSRAGSYDNSPPE